ncbi:Calcium-activated chloride channel regulator 1-like 11, partial [Homarus americanus]
MSQAISQSGGIQLAGLSTIVWDDGNALINNGFITSRKRSLLPADRTRRALPVDPLERGDYCCGSVVPLDPAAATPTGDFFRFASGGSVQGSSIMRYVAINSVLETLQVTQTPTGDDALPPSRVTDLQVTYSHSTMNITWTAPGDDYDSGTALFVLPGTGLFSSHEEFFCHEKLSSTKPLLQFGVSIRKKKSNLGQIMESLATNPQIPHDVEVMLLNGAVVVNFLKPGVLKTFLEYEENVFMKYLMYQLQNLSKRLDIICNDYIPRRKRERSVQ